MRSRQRSLEFPTRGGKRAGAGRKPNEPGRPRLRHDRRPATQERFPVHITKRMRADVPRLRKIELCKVLRRAFVHGCTKRVLVDGAEVVSLLRAAERAKAPRAHRSEVRRRRPVLVGVVVRWLAGRDVAGPPIATGDANGSRTGDVAPQDGLEEVAVRVDRDRRGAGGGALLTQIFGCRSLTVRKRSAALHLLGSPRTSCASLDSVFAGCTADTNACHAVALGFAPVRLNASHTI